MPTTFYVTKGTTDLNTASGVQGIAGGDTITFSEGAQTISNSIGSTALVGVLATRPVNIIIGRNCNTTIGGGSYGPWYAAASTLLDHCGGGALNLYSFNNAADATTARAKMRGAGSLILQGGTVTNLEQSSGVVQAQTGGVVTNAYCSAGSSTFLYSATAITAGVFSGAGVSLQRACTTCTVTGGTVWVGREDTGSGSTANTLPTCTTLNVNGGKVIWQGGNINTLNLWNGGTIDFSNAPQAVTVVTLVTDYLAAKMSKFYSPYVAITYSSVTVRGGPTDNLPSQ